MITEKDLLDLKKDVEDAKTEVSKLNGQKQVLMAQLKKDWACTSLEIAKKQRDQLKIDKEKISKQIAKGLEDLQTKLKIV